MRAGTSFAGLSNFRDVGGLQTADGRTLKTGVLYRSDELSRLTGPELDQLRSLGIQLICDLRSPEESRKKQPKWRPAQSAIPLVNVSLHEPATYDIGRTAALGFLFSQTGGDRFREFSRAYYRHIAFERTQQIREVLTLLARDENSPALIHCTAGKDRTGFIAALVQLLADVPYEGVLADYLQTNTCFAPRLEKMIRVTRIVTLGQVSPERMRLLMMAHAEYLDEVYSAILTLYGSVDKYLAEACKVDATTLQKLKDRLIGNSGRSRHA